MPIIVATPGHMRAAMNLVTEAQDLVKNGDVAGANESSTQFFSGIRPFGQRSTCGRKSTQARANTTPRSKIVTKLSGTTGVSWKQRSYAPTSMPGLGKYAEALKEYDYLISLHLRNVTLARALSDRAWFRATCQNASFRSGQQAVKDAKAACSIMRWKDEHMIDTLAVAYAETGDLNSAVHYAAQALAVKGIPSASTKLFQQHLASFQQCKPIRS